jgi:hypothetical protein
LRLIKDIFGEVEAFDYDTLINEYEDLIKKTRFFKNISRAREASV